jgi:hypothetical protein
MILVDCGGEIRARGPPDYRLTPFPVPSNRFASPLLPGREEYGSDVIYRSAHSERSGTILERSCRSRQFLTPILACADSTVIRTSGTNRVGPVSLAQWNGRDFLSSLLGFGNAQLGEPVDA